MNDKTVVIHQPDFMPYLGFFDRLLKADIYVVFDNVQYVRSSRGWTSRDKIKTKNGERWITVGTKKAPRDTNICDIYLTEETDWRGSHLMQFKENYGRARYYDEIIPHVEALYAMPFTRMMDFNLESIRMLMKLLDIEIPFVMASELGVAGRSNELIINIMKTLGSTKYLSGVGARDYYIKEMYDEAGIEVIWQDFTHPVYEQQFPELGFIPYLSSIDVLFNCGVEHSRELLRQ